MHPPLRRFHPDKKLLRIDPQGIEERMTKLSDASKNRANAIETYFLKSF